MARNETLIDGSRPNWLEDGTRRPVRVTVWEPNTASPMPVVLMSHGTGGSVSGLEWLAEKLADAGWLVVGVDHHGNTSLEPYAPEGFSFVWERPRDLTFALDWALGEYEVDQDRVVGLGYSLGGYAVAALGGAQLNTDVLSMVLSGVVPMPPLPEFPDLIERLVEKFIPDELAAQVKSAPRDLSDDRVSRIVMLAPALGPVVDESSLEDVHVPARILWGGADVIAPPDTGALMYARAIPNASEHCLGHWVTHWSYLGGDATGGPARDKAWELIAEFLSV